MTLHQTENLVTALIAFSFAVLGLTFLLGANPNALITTFNFYSLGAMVSESALGAITGITLLLLALMTFAARFKLVSAKTVMLFAALVTAIPLLTLLSPGRWMADLGGFPIIGSGQGIIKYFAVLPLFLFLFYRDKLSYKQLTYLNFAPVAMVLLWIGSMKFFEFEANAIVGLVETSPLMSWLYDVFSVQGASNVIGSFDVFFALVLGLGIYTKNKPMIIASGIACLSVFLMTQTFLFSVPDTFNSATIVNRLGQFVIKDLWFVANLAVVAYFTIFNSVSDQNRKAQLN
ncbi:DUF417 family protein [Alteromonas sp. BL110]|uniref:DUF417 family protein n=1 Tax=Alteromonas sp. BL110 TaxID=1714845 RepID=UPI000E4C801D|nr:DUF417 family protein [Alteromonas sp. BL110]AXT37574.1 DUF417 family protein [Alteromonas sp. BL110]RKM80312.1 DUF417 family protein [Alteromonas sp. BL110]